MWGARGQGPPSQGPPAPLMTASRPRRDGAPRVPHPQGALRLQRHGEVRAGPGGFARARPPGPPVMVLTSPCHTCARSKVLPMSRVAQAHQVRAHQIQGHRASARLLDRAPHFPMPPLPTLSSRRNRPTVALPSTPAAGTARVRRAGACLPPPDVPAAHAGRSTPPATPRVGRRPARVPPPRATRARSNRFPRGTRVRRPRSTREPERPAPDAKGQRNRSRRRTAQRRVLSPRCRRAPGPPGGRGWRRCRRDARTSPRRGLRAGPHGPSER